MTLIQRLGSAPNLNVHFHMLFLDGVYAEDAWGNMHHRRVKTMNQKELIHIVHTRSYRVVRFIERRGLRA
ncbi:MAG: hypothetical protein COA46_08650 [Porticoccaceae bacterium]|nr:MAG: hypothetical protein COA46_08650 [Porticoccaceae bacterium]